MKVTKEEIPYYMAWAGRTKIPKGTPVTPATNLPRDPRADKCYWVENWEGMTEKEESWARTYGFLVIDEDVEELKTEQKSMA